MNCPRCGEEMIHYSLGDSETWNCQQCSYSGITVEHHSDRPTPESWDESIRRFYDEQTRSATPDRCVAETSSGDRCSRDAKPDERYCSQHLGMIEREGVEAVSDHQQ